MSEDIYKKVIVSEGSTYNQQIWEKVHLLIKGRLWYMTTNGDQINQLLQQIYRTNRLLMTEKDNMHSRKKKLHAATDICMQPHHHTLDICEVLKDLSICRTINYYLLSEFAPLLI